MSNKMPQENFSKPEAALEKPAVAFVPQFAIDNESIELEVFLKGDEKLKEKFMAYKERCYTLPERGLAVKKRLAGIMDITPEENKNVDRWLTEKLTNRNRGDEEFDTFFKNVAANELLKKVVKGKPKYFNDLYSIVSSRIFENPKDIEVVIHNIKERFDEILKNQAEKRERILSNPVASSEEYKLGIWKESIESQVRDAVFEAQRRGYKPSFSGFHNEIDGMQTLWLNKTPEIDPLIIKKAILENSDEWTKSRIGSLDVDLGITSKNIEINIIPKDPMMPLSEWKTLWDKVASSLPVIHTPEENMQSDNANQGVWFREAQDKIKQGKNTLLPDGLLYLGGKVIEMPHNKYKESGIKDLEQELEILEREQRQKKGNDIELIQIEIDKIKKELAQKEDNYISKITADIR